jgi:tetratricopeptide (TPR) repeat protein
LKRSVKLNHQDAPDRIRLFMSSFNIAARLTTRQAELIAQRGEHAQALEAFTEAIQLDPLYPNSYIGRALAYRRLENFPAALEDERRAEELGGAEKTAWDRLVNRSRHHWHWDFDNPDWQRTRASVHPRAGAVHQRCREVAGGASTGPGGHSTLKSSTNWHSVC